MIHGPKEGVRRQEISLKRLSLTDFKLDIQRGIHKDALVKAIEDYKLDDKFKESPYAKKVERRNKRANLTDFFFIIINLFENNQKYNKQKSQKIFVKMLQ